MAWSRADRRGPGGFACVGADFQGTPPAGEVSFDPGQLGMAARRFALVTFGDFGPNLWRSRSYSV